jgi:hypothetical protein
VLFSSKCTCFPNFSQFEFLTVCTCEMLRLSARALHRKELTYVCSRWKKAKGLVKRPEYARMQHVRLAGDLKSSFWRFHTSGVEEDGACCFPSQPLQRRDAMLRSLLKAFCCIADQRWVLDYVCVVAPGSFPCALVRCPPLFTHVCSSCLSACTSKKLPDKFATCPWQVLSAKE